MNWRFALWFPAALEMFWNRHLPGVHASVQVWASWVATAFVALGAMRVNSRFWIAAAVSATSTMTPVLMVAVTCESAECVGSGSARAVLVPSRSQRRNVARREDIR